MWKITADKYRILTDYLNIRPVYEYVLFPAEQSETAAFAENYNTAYCGCTGVKLDIVDKPYATARFYADHFFTSDIAEMAYHSITALFPVCFYDMRYRLFIYLKTGTNITPAVRR